jgi:HEAT repeat protein
LSDKDRAVRWNAASALGWMGSPARVAIPALNKALWDENGRVKKTAAESLEKTQAG